MPQRGRCLKLDRLVDQAGRAGVTSVSEEAYRTKKYFLKHYKGGRGGGKGGERKRRGGGGGGLGGEERKEGSQSLTV